MYLSYASSPWLLLCCFLICKRSRLLDLAPFGINKVDAIIHDQSVLFFALLDVALTHRGWVDYFCGMHVTKMPC